MVFFNRLRIVYMPHKFNAALRHKFDSTVLQYRVINWARNIRREPAPADWSASQHG